MTKTKFHTYDIFDNKDINTRWRYFDACLDQALNVGLLADALLTIRTF